MLKDVYACMKNMQAPLSGISGTNAHEKLTFLKLSRIFKLKKNSLWVRVKHEKEKQR
jgi:hypothetical protein